MENAGNGISESQNLKIFWGSMSPDPSTLLLLTIVPLCIQLQNGMLNALLIWGCKEGLIICRDG